MTTTARWVMKSTMMVKAQRDTTATTMTTDVDDDKGNNASLTTCDKGDNRNHDDGKDACASTATTPAHRQRRQHSLLSIAEHIDQDN